MRILILNQFYRPDVAATGQLAADLAEGLARAGHEVHVLCSRRSYDGSGDKYPSKQLADGVHIHRVGASGFGRGGIIRRLSDYVSFFALAALKALFLGRFDVCVALTTPPFVGLIGVLLRSLRGTSLVLWTMDLYPQICVAYGVLRERGLVHRLLSRISGGIYRRALLIVSLGEVMAERLIAAGAVRERITTIDNWVPGEVVRPRRFGESALRREWGLDGKVTLLYSGNLGLGHELETVMYALKKLGDVGHLRIVFVGNGRRRKWLERLAEELGLDCVEFHRPVALEQLSDLLAAGDVHLVSQRPGTQGLIVPSKLYGVLAAGRPTLFVGPEDCEVGRVLRRSGAGMVVRPGDVDDVAEGLKTFIWYPHFRRTMGMRAARNYAENFGMDKSVSRIIRAMESSLSGEFAPSESIEQAGVCATTGPLIEELPVRPSGRGAEQGELVLNRGAAENE